MNSKDLNTAWVNKWKKLHIFIIWDSLNIINPNCLRVERAIIFLKSVSNIALRAEISIVNLEITAATRTIEGFLRMTLKNRIIR